MSIKCPGCDTENTSDSQFCKKCATPLPFAGDISVTKTLETPAKGLAVGAAFAGRYQIVEELGRGGMGAVYKALDTQINEDVAIKLIRPEIAADEKVLERFSNELKLARKISHKNVCRMFHLEKGEETPYISMEYLEGEDLKSLIREKEKLPVEEAIGIAQQVCEGLVEAHRLGVVHRDLKPQNIMIDKEGQAKIMDFGIARSVEAPGVTQTGVIIGTPDYISPEQAEGQEADHRSDIYSLGVILYEMVTGSVPFKGDTALSVALKHKAQLPLDPRKRNPEIPVDLSRLILICMEKDRTKRYQSAKDLLDDLRNIQHGLPLGTKIRPHRATTLSRLIQRKWFIPAAAVLAAAIIGIVLWRVLPSRGPVANMSGKPTIAVLDFHNRTGDASLDINAENLSLLFIEDLRQSGHLTIVPDDRIYEVLSELDINDTARLTTKNLKKIARELGASHLLGGYLIRSGDSLRVVAILRETRGMDVIASFPAERPGENPFCAMVDELTPMIKSSFMSGAEVANDEDREIGMIMSKSAEAVKYYREGKKYILSDPKKSVELLEQAVKADPEFGMPYRFLWSTYGNRLGDWGQARKHREKALELLDKFSTRERLHIMYISTHDMEKREEYAKELLKVYPDDTSMLGSLAYDYYHGDGELFEEAAELYKSVIAKEKGSGIDYKGTNHFNLGIIYLALGEYEKVEDLANAYRKDVLKDAYFRPLAYAYVALGKKDLALSELKKLEDSPRKPQVDDSYLYIALGDEASAEKIYRRFLESEDKYQHLEGLWCLGDLFCLRGKFRKAEEQYREGLKLAEALKYGMATDWFHTALAFLNLRRGNIQGAIEEMGMAKGNRWLDRIQISAAAKLFDQARQMADKWRESLEKESPAFNKKKRREYSLAKGSIALGKGDYAEAIKAFKEAQELLAFPYQVGDAGNIGLYAWYFEPLALAYYRSGDLEKAQIEYEKISKMTLARAGAWDIYAKSFYMLGKIAEQRGWPGKAIEYYKEFLEFWKDADHGLPEVEDAKNRLEQLKN